MALFGQQLTAEKQAICNILIQIRSTVGRMRDEQQRRLCNTALDKESDDFWKGLRPHSDVLQEFLTTMNAIDHTIRVNGSRATINALLARPETMVEHRNKQADWHAEKTCDELVGNRACPEHNQGICPWGHNQDKATDIRGNPELLEIAKSRLKAKELTKKTAQPNSASDNTRETQRSNDRNSSGGRNRGGQKGGRGGGKKAAAANASSARLDEANGGTSSTPTHQMAARRMHLLRSNSRRRPDMPGQLCFAFLTAAAIPNGFQHRWLLANYCAASRPMLRTHHVLRQCKLPRLGSTKVDDTVDSLLLSRLEEVRREARLPAARVTVSLPTQVRLLSPLTSSGHSVPWLPWQTGASRH